MSQTQLLKYNKLKQS